MVEFLCPNGHKIRCPDEQAGRAAKCPRCGVRFRIPVLSDLTPTAARNSDSSVSVQLTDSNGSSPVLNGGVQPEAPKEPEIEFLCPRGHHLHGPASLQGRPGECPECGSRFRIPTFDETPPAESTDEEEISLERAESRQSRVVEDAPPQDTVADAARRTEPPKAQARAGESSPLVSLPSGSAGQAAVGHPMADLFTRLWAAKGEGSRVEVHLNSGGILLPESFARTLSQQDHAVFVAKDPDNSYTLTVVPWDSVARVILRGVRQVPGEVI